MINSKHTGHSSRANQLGLFDNLAADPGPAIKAAMKEAAGACPLSRDQIVLDMNRMMTVAGITCNGRAQAVTEAILDKWLAPQSLGHVPPLRVLHIFCRAVGSNLPLEVLASFFRGARVISEDDAKLLAWARHEVAARQARREARRLAEEVGL